MTKQVTIPGKQHRDELSRARIEASFANLEYLAYSRLMPAPFVQFVSGHMPSGVVTQSHHHPCVALHGCLQGPLILVTPQGEKQLEAGTGTMLACYLVHQGADADTAVERVRAIRPGSIETAEQFQAVRDYAATLQR
jgi:hypothetical protein